jgi:hypothetical protein
MVVAFARYSRDDSFAVLRENLRFVAVMAAGSVAGPWVAHCCSASYRTAS